MELVPEKTKSEKGGFCQCNVRIIRRRCYFIRHIFIFLFGMFALVPALILVFFAAFFVGALKDFSIKNEGHTVTVSLTHTGKWFKNGSVAFHEEALQEPGETPSTSKDLEHPHV